MIWLNRIRYWLVGTERRKTLDRRGSLSTAEARAAFGAFWKNYDRHRNRRVAAEARRIRDRHQVIVSALKRTDWS